MCITSTIIAITGGVVLIIVGIIVTVYFSVTGSTTVTGGENIEIDINIYSVENRKYQKLYLQQLQCMLLKELNYFCIFCRVICPASSLSPPQHLRPYRLQQQC